MVILENIDIDIDIDKAILQNIDNDKISNRFKFGISNRANRERTRLICTYMREKFAITLQESLLKFGFLTYYGAFHLYSVNQLCRLG